MNRKEAFELLLRRAAAALEGSHGIVPPQDLANALRKEADALVPYVAPAELSDPAIEKHRRTLDARRAYELSRHDQEMDEIERGLRSLQSKCAHKSSQWQGACLTCLLCDHHLDHREGC